MIETIVIAILVVISFLVILIIAFNKKYSKFVFKNSEKLITNNEKLTLAKVKNLLAERFSTVDFESAKEDVINFVSDKNSVLLWKKELFISTIEKLIAK